MGVARTGARVSHTNVPVARAGARVVGTSPSVAWTGERVTRTDVSVARTGGRVAKTDARIARTDPGDPLTARRVARTLQTSLSPSLPVNPSYDVAPDGQPFQVLFERSGLPVLDVSPTLLATYGGGLGFAGTRVLANFVESVDGVVALPGTDESGHIISQDSAADRFVMGLLRSCVDAVLVGAGTFRKATGALWHADAVYPAGAALFAETRGRLGLTPQPKLVIITGSGRINVTQPAVRDALVVTTPHGEERLRPEKPSTTEILVSDSATVHLPDVLTTLRSKGLRTVLAEGGPSVLAELVAGRLLDELFVTVSPSLFGRYATDRRKSLTEGIDLAGRPLDLLAARRHGSHLFLRYALAERAG